MSDDIITKSEIPTTPIINLSNEPIHPAVKNAFENAQPTVDLKTPSETLGKTIEATQKVLEPLMPKTPDQATKS